MHANTNLAFNVKYRVAQKLYIFRHTIFLESFKIKLNGFDHNVPRVFGNKDWVVAVRCLQNISIDCCTAGAQQQLQAVSLCQPT